MERRTGNDRRTPRFSIPGNGVFEDVDNAAGMVSRKIMSLSQYKKALG